jgi:hypothetical protein
MQALNNHRQALTNLGTLTNLGALTNKAWSFDKSWSLPVTKILIHK